VSAIRPCDPSRVYVRGCFVANRDVNKAKPGHATNTSTTRREKEPRSLAANGLREESRDATGEEKRGERGETQIRGCIPLFFPVDAFEKFLSAARRGNHSRGRWAEWLKYRSQERSVRARSSAVRKSQREVRGGYSNRA